VWSTRRTDLRPAPSTACRSEPHCASTYRRRTRDALKLGGGKAGERLVEQQHLRLWTERNPEIDQPLPAIGQPVAFIRWMASNPDNLISSAVLASRVRKLWTSRQNSFGADRLEEGRQWQTLINLALTHRGGFFKLRPPAPEQSYAAWQARRYHAEKPGAAFTRRAARTPPVTSTRSSKKPSIVPRTAAAERIGFDIALEPDFDPTAGIVDAVSRT
jgi:hypothetical protein